MTSSTLSSLALPSGCAALRAAVPEHSTFDTATQEAIALAVAAADGCNYFAHLMPNMFTNYFNHYAHTERDLPPAPDAATR